MRMLTDRGRLCVGSYLHCMVSGSDHFDLATGESRVVSVVAELRLVHRSEVVHVSCKFSFANYCLAYDIGQIALA